MSIRPGIPGSTETVLRRGTLLPFAWVLAVLAGCRESEPGDALADPVTLVVHDSGRWAAEPFTRIDGVLTLPDGGLLVADFREGGIFRIDADGLRRGPFGTQGEGPGEFTGIEGLFPLSADTFALLDPRQRRLIRFTHDGSTIDQVGFPPELREGPWGVDGRRLLARAPLLGEGEPEQGLPLLAWSWKDDRIDTLTTLRHQVRRLVESGTPELPFEAWTEEPFSPADVWSTAPGRVTVIARADPYRFDWFEDGVGREGPALDFEPVPVTPSDRERFARFPNAHQWDWPSERPPFPPDARPVHTSTGDLWLQSWQEAPDGNWYDRISPDGERTGRILVPPEHRVLLVPEPHLFTVVEDELGLQWIHRGEIVELDAP